ncbi:ABC transporter substrate-binding protein [Haloarcula sp. JP-L23]|uniref:ABC transporter substrate-binding protein n=1 Tax=Haloarcula sp. JP-L23 TaxID=2716717 RepID=UPI00140F3B34|nr:ABC transporter substrate-binding protein [Haloarcula sp. JP-L23]
MADQTETERTLSRREYIQYGGTVLGSGLLAGCSEGSGTESTPASDGTERETTETTGERYSVSMAPMGEVTFDSVPQRVFTVLTSHAGMAFALGRGDDLTAVYATEYSDSLMNAFTPRLDGVTVDWTDLYSSWNPSKEKLYALDSDVHLADPANVLTMGDWDEPDVAEVRENVAPWFGNTFSAQHGSPPPAYADSYEYYTLWETFERVAAVFRERKRYDALLAERDAMRSTIEDGLPPESERPTVAMMLNSTSGDGMWVYDVNAPGYHSAHVRPLGARDAFGDDVGHGDKIDYEALLAADPDVILALGGLVETHDMRAIRATLEDDPVASEVTAVDAGRVYAQGTRHQGPIVNLFQLEMSAKQLYPEQFGAWPDYESGPYPALSASERLFDHDRVADVIAGSV